MRPPLEVADLFRQYGEAYQADHPEALWPEQQRVIRAISICRTCELGGHIDGCAECGHRQISYNSCRNRHCPKCQALESARWLSRHQAQLLPVEYFHVVFTLPRELAPLALQNKRVVYNLLFRSVAETLTKIAAERKHLGAEIGFLAVLHTWGQQLQHHPHLHCVVPGGGLSFDGKQWKSCRQGFFLPVKVLSHLFRRLFLEEIERAFEQEKLSFHGRIEELSKARRFQALLRGLKSKEWVVYAKPPFGSAEKVLEYLCRYTHRVAISNDRLVKMVDGKITFRWKDYRDQNRQKIMTLPAEEFMRRFLLHVLPHGFQRIRQYGLLSNRRAHAALSVCRQLLAAGSEPDAEAMARGDYRELFEELTGRSLVRCPACGSSRWGRLEVLIAGHGYEPLRGNSSMATQVDTS